LGTFLPGQRVEDTLADVPSVSLSTSEINHPDAWGRLQRLSQRVVIYSGMPGAILRNEVLACGRRFLHVHGGSAPAFRGSTAFYYELLERGQFGVTALWLERELDTGPRLAQCAFTPPRGLELDRVLDPMVRAALLVRVLDVYSRTGAFPSLEPAEAGRVHYVIHPVLKHLVLRRYSRKLDPQASDEGSLAQKI
jgi:methionyl-tRNA formyltransferase